MTIRSQYLLVAVASLLAYGCASGDQSSASRRETQSPSMPKENIQVVCQVDLSIGGATSKEFERALTRTYRSIKITLVAGTNAVSKVSGKDAVSDHFLGGVESSSGKAIVRVLEEQKPWDWEGVKGTRFANNLYFNGTIREKKWKYVSVYPDAKLESLLVRLRKELERR
jgi:hypothetical protein